MPESVTVIDAATPLRRWDAEQRRRFAELAYFFAWRDIKVRYKQTVLGVAWAVLQPALLALLLTLVLGQRGLGDGAVDYRWFVLSSLVLWFFVANAVGQGAESVVSQAHLLGKVSFPRLALPSASLLAAGVDFLVASGLLVVTLVLWGPGLPWRAFAALGFLALAAATALGVSIWLAAINVRFRDVRYVVPFLLQAWLFASPVVYPVSVLPASVRGLCFANPLAGAMEGFRWAVLGTPLPSATGLLLSAGVACTVLVSGWYYFRWVEPTFADVA